MLLDNEKIDTEIFIFKMYQIYRLINICFVVIAFISVSIWDFRPRYYDEYLDLLVFFIELLVFLTPMLIYWKVSPIYKKFFEPSNGEPEFLFYKKQRINYYLWTMELNPEVFLTILNLDIVKELLNEHQIIKCQKQSKQLSLPMNKLTKRKKFIFANNCLSLIIKICIHRNKKQTQLINDNNELMWNETVKKINRYINFSDEIY